MRYPRVCRNGHAIEGLADEYARPGREHKPECRECRNDEKKRYRRAHPEYFREAYRMYDASERGHDRHARYQASTKGILTRVRSELRQARQRKAELEAQD